MPRLLLVTTLVLVVAAIGVVLLRPDPPLPGVVRDPMIEVDDLAFLDHGQGDEPRTVTLVPPDGGITLVYFGYLSCPDICPSTMADLRRARELIGSERAARTIVAFVTLDPERDSPQRQREYLRLFFDGGVLALEARHRADLDAAAARFGVRYEVEEHEPGAERYDVAHTAITYLVDDRGRVVRELPFGTPASDYARAIQAALDDPVA